MNVYSPTIKTEQISESAPIKKAAEVFGLKPPQFEMAETLTWAKGINPNFRKKVLWACWSHMTTEDRQAFLDKIHSTGPSKEKIDPVEYALTDLDKMIDWAPADIKGMLLGIMKQMRSQKRWVPSKKQSDFLTSIHAEYRRREPDDTPEEDLIE